MSSRLAIEMGKKSARLRDEYLAKGYSLATSIEAAGMQCNAENPRLSQEKREENMRGLVIRLARGSLEMPLPQWRKDMDQRVLRINEEAARKYREERAARPPATHQNTAGRAAAHNPRQHTTT